MCEHIIDVIDCYNIEDKSIINDIVSELDLYSNANPMLKNVEIKSDIKQINTNMKEIVYIISIQRLAAYKMRLLQLKDLMIFNLIHFYGSTLHTHLMP